MLKTDLDNAQKCLLETYELAANYGTGEFKNTATYLNLMQKLCEIRGELERNERALEVASQEHTKADFETVFERERKKNVKKFDSKKTSEYKEFDKRLKQIEKDVVSPEEAPSTSKADDVCIMTSQINPIDPLTKQLIKNPMRNKICGHAYEKTTILEQIKINPNLRCPVAGCGYNKYIKQSDLFEDHALKLHLQKQADTYDDDD